MTGPEFCDQPGSNPTRRSSMEQLLYELAERNGDPTFPVIYMKRASVISKRVRAQW